MKTLRIPLTVILTLFVLGLTMTTAQAQRLLLGDYVLTANALDLPDALTIEFAQDDNGDPIASFVTAESTKPRPVFSIRIEDRPVEKPAGGQSSTLPYLVWAFDDVLGPEPVTVSCLLSDDEAEADEIDCTCTQGETTAPCPLKRRRRRRR